MRKTFAKLTTVAAATALLLPSTAALAGTPAPAPQVQGSWMELSMLSPVGAAALGGAAAAAQPMPPPPQRGYGSLPPPPIPVLMVVLATLLTMVYIATKNEHHEVPAPNSPA